MLPNVGDIVGGKYRIVRLIGDGGMGAVFEARHEILGTLVALKFLHAELARRQGLATRFLQEARVSASIQSPHVTRVTDVDQTPDGSPYLVMELLSGESLQQLIDRLQRLPRDQAIDFTLQVLSGLEAAHALGVVHRDLKPDNVFITPSSGGPVCKLLDFGIAKLRQTNEYTKGLTRPGALMGTPEYMAPEQLYSADRVDHRADLYSLGVMLFEMLSGQRPAVGEDAAAIVGNVMAGRVRRLDELMPSLPADLVSTVHRAINPDKAQRFQSAIDMRLALAPFAGQLSHAGKLAATPVPIGISGTPPPVAAAEAEAAVQAQEQPRPEARQITADEPALQAPATMKDRVAPTLPPDDRPSDDSVANEIRGGTQEASKEMIAELAARNAAAHAVPAPPAPAVGYTAPPQPSYQHYGPTQTRPKKSGLGAVLALLAGLVLTAGIIGLVVLLRQGKDDPQPESIGLGQTSPNTTIAPQGGGNEVTPPPNTPPPTTEPPPATSPTGTGTGKKPKKDAGADSGAGDAGIPGLTWPPVIPSSLPPLPSGLPQIPGWPIPGFQPAPSGDQ